MLFDACMINQLVGTANVKRKCNFFNLGKVNKDATSETSSCLNTKNLEETAKFSANKIALSALCSQASVVASVSMINTSLPTSFITQATSSSDRILQVASTVVPCSQAAVPISQVTQAKLPNASVAQAVLTKAAVTQAALPTISIANSSSARICSPVASSMSPFSSTLSILPVSLADVSLTGVSPPVATLPNINHTVESLPISGDAMSCPPKITTGLASSVASVVSAPIPISPVGNENIDFQTFPNDTSVAYANTDDTKQYPVNLILPYSIETVSSGPILLNQSTPLTKVVFVTSILPAPVLKNVKLSTKHNQQVGSNSLKEVTSTENCPTTCLQSLENEKRNPVKLKKPEKQVKLLPLHIENSSKLNGNVYPKTIGKSPTEQKFGIDSLISNTEVDSFLNDFSATNITNNNDNLEVVSTLLPSSPPPPPPSSSFTLLPSISHLGTLPSPLSLSSLLTCSVTTHTTGLVSQNSLESVESVSSTSVLSPPTALSPLLPSSESLSNSSLVTSTTVSETLLAPVTFSLHLSSPLPTSVSSITYSSITMTAVVSSTPLQSVLSPSSSSLITSTLLSSSISSSSKSITSTSSTILTSSSPSSSSLSTTVPQTRSGATLNSDNRHSPILSSSLLTHRENRSLKNALNQTVEFSSTNHFIKNGTEGSCLMMSTNFDFLSKTADGKKLSSQKLQLKHRSSDRDTHLITKTHSVTSMLEKEMNKTGVQKKNIKKGQHKVLKQNLTKNVPYKDFKETSVRLKRLHKSDHKSEITKRWGNVVKNIQNDQDNNLMFKSFVIGNSTSGSNTKLQLNKKTCVRKNNKHTKKKITSDENDLQSNTKTNESHKTQPKYDNLTTHQVNSTVSSSSNSVINPGINALDPKSQKDQNLNMASIMNKPKEVNALSNSQLFLSHTNSSQASANITKNTATVASLGKQKSTVLTNSTSFSANTSNKKPVQVASNSSSSLQVKLHSSSVSSKQQAIVASENTICTTQKTSISQNLTFIPTMKERTIRNKWLAAEKALSNSTFNTTDILANHNKNTNRYINLQQRKRGHGISAASHLSKISKLNLSERTKKMKASKSFSAEALCKPAANQLALQKQWNFNKLGEPVNSGNKIQKSQIKSQNELQLTSNKLSTPSSQPHQLLTNKPPQNHQHKLKHPLDVTNTNPLPTILNIFAPAPIPHGVSENQSNFNQAPNNNFSNENQMSNPCDMNMMGENIGGSNFPDNIMMNGNQSLFTNFSTDSLLNEPSVPYAVDNIIAQSNTGPLSNCWNPWLPQDMNFNEHMFANNNNGAPQRNRLVSNTECSPIKSIMSILEAQPNPNFQQFQQNLTMNTMQGSPMVEQRNEPRRTFNNQVRMNNQQTAQQVNFQNNLRFMPPIQHPSSWNLHELHKPYLQQSNVSNANNVFSASVNNINNNLHSHHNKQNVKERAGPALGNYSLINSA